MKQYLKQLLCLLLLCSVCIPLASCEIFPNRRKSYFEEGLFYGYTERDSKIDAERVFCFEVKKISKEEYEQADGVNVVMDGVLEPTTYFSFLLYEGEGEDRIIYNFVHLAENVMPNDIPICYEDDNGNVVGPKNQYRMCTYTVVYENLYINFYSELPRLNDEVTPVDRNRSYFEEGLFHGKDKNTGREFCFEVRTITKEEYEQAEGINVVMDGVLEPTTYFSFLLYEGEGEDRTEYHFSHLKEKEQVEVVPISYEDEQGYAIYPQNQRSENIVYTVIYNELHIDFLHTVK